MKAFKVFSQKQCATPEEKQQAENAKERAKYAAMTPDQKQALLDKKRDYRKTDRFKTLKRGYRKAEKKNRRARILASFGNPTTCMICLFRFDEKHPAEIDTFHPAGWKMKLRSPARGVLCGECNSRLSHYEPGERTKDMTPQWKIAAGNYLFRYETQRFLQWSKLFIEEVSSQ